MSNNTNYSKKIRGYLLLNRYEITCFILVFIIFFGFSLLNKPSFYLADSLYYDQLSGQFVNNDLFNFTNYPDSYRGYLLPFIFFIFKNLGTILFSNTTLGFLSLNALMLTVFVTIIIPNLLQVKKGLKKVIGALIYSLIFVYFWPDFLVYPLSDMYALFFFATSLVCVIRVEKAIRGSVFSRPMDYFWIVLLGISLYASYNIRTVYQIPNIVLILMLLVRNFSFLKKNYYMPMAFSLLLLIGYLIPAIPQLELNKKYNGVYSTSVMTDKFFGNNLSITQIFWGIQYTRYETNIESFVGNSITYPEPGVRFVDVKGKELLNEIGSDLTIKNLLTSYLKHPIDFSKIYARHAVNGFNPIFRESYITDMSTDKSIAFVLNYLILFVFLLLLIKKLKFFYNHCIYLTVMAFATLIAIPGAIETRFTLPAFMIIYGVVFYLFDKSKLMELTKNKMHIMLTIILFVFGFIYTYRVIETTFESTEELVQVKFTN